MGLFRKLFTKSPKRYTPADVKPGDTILIEWSRIKGKLGEVDCLNNDRKARRMFIQINWTDQPNERFVWSYNDDQFENFHLLNELRMRERETLPIDVPDNNSDGDQKIEL